MTFGTQPFYGKAGLALNFHMYRAHCTSKNLGKTEKNSTPMTLFNAKHVTSINLPRLWWLYIWPGNFVNVEQKIAGYVISSHVGTKNECRVVCGGGRRCKHWRFYEIIEFTLVSVAATTVICLCTNMSRLENLTCSVDCLPPVAQALQSVSAAAFTGWKNEESFFWCVCYWREMFIFHFYSQQQPRRVRARQARACLLLPT